MRRIFGMSKRMEYLDIAKFIGIFCIYLGHFGNQAGNAYNFVFSFHVPLFSSFRGVLNHWERIVLGDNILLRILNVFYYRFIFLHLFLL